MMNQYRDRFGRMGSRMGGCGDASPYRRPQSRDGMLRQSFNRSGGCGCGLVSGHGQSRYTEGGTSRTPVCQAPAPSPERPNCGCGGSVSVNCKKLMEQIRAVDFALYETVLYLDVYPLLKYTQVLVRSIRCFFQTCHNSNALGRKYLYL